MSYRGKIVSKKTPLFQKTKEDAASTRRFKNEKQTVSLVRKDDLHFIYCSIINDRQSGTQMTKAQFSLQEYEALKVLGTRDSSLLS